MPRPPTDPHSLKPATRLVTASRRFNEHGMVNPAVYHASTVLFDSVEALHDRKQEYVYGRRGTPTVRALELAIAEHEGGFGCKLHPSGLSAAATTLLTFLKPGDHLLMTDAVYQPVRLFCDRTLQRLGITTSFFDPAIGGAVEDLFRRDTRLLYLESPGSQTMEVLDVPAMAAAAAKHGIVTAIDNTWSAGHYFKAFAAGCDVSIQAATKYVSGHSDVMLGSVTCSAAHWETFGRVTRRWGCASAPTTSISACAACAPSMCACASTWRAQCASPPGLPGGRKWQACFTPPCPAPPAMNCGPATSPAPAAFFPSS